MREVFEKAKALIEKGWTQFHCAVNANGEPCPVESPDAVCFCSGGAVFAVLGPSDPSWQYLRTLEEIMGEPVALWNDKKGRKKEEVIEVFEKAIASFR